jgi:hypothetical protein
MSIYHVFCNEKKGFWSVNADSAEEAVCLATKNSNEYTGVFTVKVAEFESKFMNTFNGSVFKCMWES